MEDWISPWTFLLPGTIKDSSITDMIQSEVLTHKTLSRSTDSQKFVIYRLTDGYSLLPSSLQDILPTLVSCILITSEDAVQVLCKRISRVGASISPNEPRNPTILVIDQVSLRLYFFLIIKLTSAFYSGCGHTSLGINVMLHYY